MGLQTELTRCEGNLQILQRQIHCADTTAGAGHSASLTKSGLLKTIDSFIKSTQVVLQLMPVAENTKPNKYVLKERMTKCCEQGQSACKMPTMCCQHAMACAMVVSV